MKSKKRDHLATSVGRTIVTKDVLKTLLSEGEEGRYTIPYVNGGKVVLTLRSEADLFNVTPLVYTNKLETRVFVDMRPYLNSVKLNQDISYPDVVKDRGLGFLAVTNALLLLENELGMTSDIKLLKEPYRILARILSNGVSIKFNLNPSDSDILSILVANYVYCLQHLDPKNVDRDLLIKTISKQVGLTTTYVTNVLEDVGHASTLNELCATIPDKVSNLLLKDIEPYVFISAVSNLWYGTSSKEYLGIAIENTSYWIALISMLATTKQFKRSKLGEMVVDSKKKMDEVNGFVLELYKDIPDENLLK